MLLNFFNLYSICPICSKNLISSSITFHCFTVSLWAQNLPFQIILSSTIVCLCLSDWSHGSRPITGLICSSVLCFSSIFYVLVIPKCSRLSWPALWFDSIWFFDVTAFLFYLTDSSSPVCLPANKLIKLCNNSLYDNFLKCPINVSSWCITCCSIYSLQQW